ncbi:MAG TPA: hypothetical protein VN260_04865 [Dissulfurispiraceae bacterium]|nr:hypothetical protein [Dissulfurispiraceae bacterium]
MTRDKMRHRLQHRLNSVHVYCRMCNFMPKTMAFRLARVYERIVHPLLYK